MADSLIQPLPAAPAAAEPTVDPTQAAPAAPEAAGELPDALLQVPAMQAIMAGAPPAVSATPADKFTKSEAGKLISDNKQPLLDAGVGFYRSLDGKTGVIFNGLHIHQEDLVAADRMGKLTTIAPPFDAVNQEISKSGLQNPALRPANVPKGAANPRLKAPPTIANTVSPAPAPQPAPAVRQATAGLQKAILGQRARNAAVGAPTTGPAPGAGRLLNSILKPVV